MNFLRRLLGIFFRPSSEPEASVASQPTSTVEAEAKIEDDSYWCFIPEGTVAIEGIRGSYIAANTSETIEVSPFLMAKYPITNAQYARFMAAGGYHQRDYWTREGWDYRQREGWEQPKYWDDPNFNQPTQPVVGVTWYEALAFANWLESSEDELVRDVPSELRITLPAEWHWQRAAQGDNNTRYPWGNRFSPNAANTEESGFQRPTPVTQYPRGASPFDVLDMSGNVLEWTLTDWRSGSDDVERADANRILRGGSFANPAQIATVQNRTYSNAYFRRNDFGFRVCAVPIVLF